MTTAENEVESRSQIFPFAIVYQCENIMIVIFYNVDYTLGKDYF